MKKLLLLLALASSVFAAEYSVEIVGFAFVPPELTIVEGDTVVWTNLDLVPHTATADDASWDSGTLNHGESWSHTFQTAGSWEYHCTIHPEMTGTVTVETGPSDVDNGSWGAIKATFN
jgi:plastocyanin